jgi:cupin 2 domain-containing protein
VLKFLARIASDCVVVSASSAGTLTLRAAKIAAPGDFVNIPAHTKHRVEWTTPDEPTIWLAVRYGGGERADL